VDKHLKAILERDSEGIRNIYSAYQDKIVRYVVDNSGNVAEGEDIFQEAIIIIFKQVREQKLQLTVPFYTYLYAVAKKLWLKKLRKNKQTIVTFPDELEYIDEHHLDQIILEEERYRLYRSKFRLLSDQCQQLMRLF
jgi:RNA polymerase sigma factor (sigma-70 family)